MKKRYKVAFALLIPLLAVFGIYDFYWTLPIEGAYDTSPISYPVIDRVELKNRLSQLDSEKLEQMKLSGMEILKWQNILNKVDATVVSELVPEFDPFFVKEHYPYDEVYDRETHSLYYYHSHRQVNTGTSTYFSVMRRSLTNMSLLTAGMKKSIGSPPSNISSSRWHSSGSFYH